MLAEVPQDAKILRVPETRFALGYAAMLYSWMNPPGTSRDPLLLLD